MSPDAYAILYLGTVSFAALLAIAGAIAAWISWQRELRQRRRKFLEGYDRAMQNLPNPSAIVADQVRRRFGPDPLTAQERAARIEDEIMRREFGPPL